MRIAYLANYQGRELVARRRVRRNLALAGTQKIRTLAVLMQELGHKVVIFSKGSPAERSLRFYRGFTSVVSNGVQVVYAPAWDFSYLGAVLGSQLYQRTFRDYHRQRPFDMVVTYNADHSECMAALWAAASRVPIVLEYEDDATVDPRGRLDLWTVHRRWLLGKLAPHLAGVLAVSPELQAQFRVQNTALIRGVVDDDVASLPASGPPRGRPLRFLFAGSMGHNKGVESLITAWRAASRAAAELHLVGDGPLLKEIRAATLPDDVYIHGYLSRPDFVRVLGDCDVCLNPHVRSSKPGNIFPFKLVEYLGAGKPVISTRMGSIEPELEQGLIYVDGQSGELERAITRTLQSPDGYLRAAQSCRRAVLRRYGREAVKQKLGEVIAGACRADAASTSEDRRGR